MSRVFEIDFTSVNQCFLKFIWNFFIENRFIFQYFPSNFLFVDETFWMITFQIPSGFEFSLERILIFSWICLRFNNWFWLVIFNFWNKIWTKNSIFIKKHRQFFQHWKISFRRWFWRFQEKLDEKFLLFSENFVNFFKIENMVLVGDFEVSEKKFDKKSKLFSENSLKIFSKRWSIFKSLIFIILTKSLNFVKNRDVSTSSGIAIGQISFKWEIPIFVKVLNL